jgi:hypothetical protein
MSQSKFEQLESLVSTIKADYTKALEGNKAASTRTRVGMQQVKALAQDIRAQIFDLRQQ